MTTPELSIVVPARNEAARLPEAVERLVEFVSAHGSAELVVAADTGSFDETVAVAEKLAAGRPDVQVAPVRSAGKGYAVLAGVEAARGRIALMADVDLAVDPSQFGPLVAGAERGAIAIASRSMPGSRRIGEPRTRYALGRLFNFVVRALVLPGIRDSQCGFKAFPRERGLGLLRRVGALGWTFDVELLALARREGLEILEVPVMWTYGHGSTMRLAGDAAGVVRDLLAVRGRVGRVARGR